MFERVLVADGDVDARDRFHEILTGLAYKVICVPNSSELLTRLRIDRPALIILDENLPTQGGLEAVHEIRKFDVDIKIVILTANDPDISISRLNSLGISEVLKKDFSTHIMMKKILELLKEKKFDIVNEKRQGIILIIDDEDEIRKILSAFLQKKGYIIVTASSGEAGLDELKARSFDLVLCDVRMPGMDGLVVLRNIKRINESTKVVMLTALQDKDIIGAAIKEGASDYLVKPFNLGKLDAVIASLLIPFPPAK